MEKRKVKNGNVYRKHRKIKPFRAGDIRREN